MIALKHQILQLWVLFSSSISYMEEVSHGATGVPYPILYFLLPQLDLTQNNLKDGMCLFDY